MAPATRKKSSSARQRPSCYVLLTRRVTHKPPEPTSRRTRSQSAAVTGEDGGEEEEVQPVKAKATRKGKGKAKVVHKKPTPPTEDEARTPTPTVTLPGPSLQQASSTRKPPPPPKHIHLGKPAISFEAARDISRLTTPDEGRSLLHPDPHAQSEPFVPLLLHDTDNPVLEEMTEPEMEMRGGEEGRWRIKGSSSRRMGSPPPVMPRDYPFADPSSARKSPPPRAHPHRIGKPPQPESSDGDGHTEPASSPTNTIKKKVSVTLGGARFERELELSTPVKHQSAREPPPIPEPPSGGTPKIPPNFRRDDTASPQHHPHPPPSARPLSHRKLIAEASLRRRQQLAEERPVSPLPPSSEPSSARTERVVQDTSVHNLSHDAFWPGDEELYAGSDPGDHYPSDEEDKENIVQVATSHRRTHSAVVDVLGVGRTVAAEESFETPQKPRRYNIRPPATLNTQDEATAALFAPDMSDESGVSNILDYASVAERRRRDEEERRRRAFEFGAEEGAYVPVGEDADFMLPEPLSDDSIMGYDGYSPTQLSGSDKENLPHDEHLEQEEDPATPTARRTQHSHHDHHDGLPASETRGILQPRLHTSPARHPAGEDPFGILATEALLRARKAYSSGVKPKAKTSAAAAASIARASASKPVPAPSRVLARSASGRTLADPSPVKRVPFGQRSFQDLNPPTPGEDRDRFADLDLPPSSPPRAENELHSPARSQRSAATHDSIEDMYATPERGDFALVLSTPVRACRAAEREPVAGSDNSIPAFPTSSPAVSPRKERRQEEVQRTPMTPRNGPRARGSVTMRRHKSHGGVGEEQEYDGRGEFEEREPSPSPVKQRPSTTYIPELDEGEETETEMPKKIAGTGGKGKEGKGKEREVPLIEPKTKGKENTGRARGRKRKSDEAGVGGEEDEDPELVTRRLEDMLPRPRVKAKKSTRPAAKKARRHLAEDSDEEGEEEEEEVQRSSSLPGSPVKKPRKRGTTYGGARARQRRRGEESTPEEVREDRERRRLERVEYYKGLEGYRLRKEKVYVV